MSLEHAFRLALHDPGLLARKCAARATSVVPFFPGRAIRRLGEVRFECDFELGGKVRDMYFGAYEPDEVEVFRRCLSRGDMVVDAGANIGFFTAVAASRVGIEGAVHAFEPVPAYFERLIRLRDANPRHRIVAHPDALGEVEGESEIRVAGTANLGWNTMVPQLMSRDSAASVHRVHVRRLDRYLEEQRIERLALLKVDVEGFELRVLRGFTGWLEGRANRPAILCEVAPGAYPPQGARVQDLFDLLGRYGYRGHEVSRRAATIAPESLRGTTNVLFLADGGMAL